MAKTTKKTKPLAKKKKPTRKATGRTRPAVRKMLDTVDAFLASAPLGDAEAWVRVMSFIPNYGVIKVRGDWRGVVVEHISTCTGAELAAMGGTNV